MKSSYPPKVLVSECQDLNKKQNGMTFLPTHNKGHFWPAPFTSTELEWHWLRLVQTPVFSIVQLVQHFCLFCKIFWESAYGAKAQGLNYPEKVSVFYDLYYKIRAEFLNLNILNVLGGSLLLLVLLVLRTWCNFYKMFLATTTKMWVVPSPLLWQQKVSKPCQMSTRGQKHPSWKPIAEPLPWFNTTWF